VRCHYLEHYHQTPSFVPNVNLPQNSFSQLGEISGSRLDHLSGCPANGICYSSVFLSGLGVGDVTQIIPQMIEVRCQ
jgi:hypothetical protein